MIRLALILWLSGFCFGRHFHRKEESDFQDAVESIARQSIQNVFNDKNFLDDEPDTRPTSSKSQHLHERKKLKKHHAKSTARHVHKEQEEAKAYSNEDQSLYEGNLYQDLYRHLPILPMVPVPLFYEGEDYSGDEPETASGDELTSDIKLESKIKGEDDDEDQGPPSLANQVPPQTFNYPEVKSFASKKKKKTHKKKKYHHKKQHVSNFKVQSRNSKPSSAASLPTMSKLTPTVILENLQAIKGFGKKKVKESVSHHGLKSGSKNVLKNYAQTGSIGAQSLPSSNNVQASSNTNTIGDTQNGQVTGQSGSFPTYGNNQGLNQIQDQSKQLQSNISPLAPINQDNQLQGNYLGSNSLGSFGNMLGQYGGTQQDLTGTGLPDAQPNSLLGAQTQNLLGAQTQNAVGPKGGSENTCPPPCPAACAPKCSDACCNSDYSALSSLLQSSCSPSCAPSYNLQCCNSFSQLQGAASPAVAPQLPMQCSPSCSPQYSSSCCGTSGAVPQQPIQQTMQQPIQQPMQQTLQQPIQQPIQQSIQQPMHQPIQQPLQSLQMPMASPQSMCPSSCAPDYASSCCGSMLPQQISAPTQPSVCSSACAPQYLQSCCNGALSPSQAMMASQCSSSCAPSYLPSCCAGAAAASAQTAQTLQSAPAAQGCAPACAPQFNPSCCSSPMGYGNAPMAVPAAAPPPPPFQVRVGFRTYSLSPKQDCPSSCYSQCTNSCPSQCCGMVKKSTLLSVPLKTPKPLAPQVKAPAVSPPAVKQSVLKQPAVKPLSRQIALKAPVVKPVQMKVNVPGHPLNWDKK